MFLTLDKANKFTLFSLNRNIHDFCGSEYYLHDVDNQTSGAPLEILFSCTDLKMIFGNT